MGFERNREYRRESGKSQKEAQKRLIEFVAPDSDYNYSELKSFAMEAFRLTRDWLHDSPVKTVYTAYAYQLDSAMEENGVEKLINLIAGMFYLIEHGEIDHKLAYITYWNIAEFETGDYDYLLSDTDLIAIKYDIDALNIFYKNNPQSTERSS